MKAHHMHRSMGWRVAVATGLALGAMVVAPSSGDAVTASPTEGRAPGTAGSTSQAGSSGPIGSTTSSTRARSGSNVARFIVETRDTSLTQVARGVRTLGGDVVAAQETLGTLIVDLPARRADQLRAVPGVHTVTADSRIHLQTAGVGPTGLDGDMTNVARLTGATTFWRNGYSGQGVDVALLDSGVLPVEGLNTPNKLVIGPDLSFESQQPRLRGLDTFGHGTHMAGIIAGRDGGTGPLTYAGDNTHFLGMAPGSRVVSLKLADAQGATDVSQVIAAIDWVVAHGRQPGLNIRVLNLSFGTDATQDYRLDPLAHAAEVAWNRGVVVVVSAGNSGGTSTGLSNPAYDPAVLAVGAVDTRGTADRSDDVVPAFSQRGDIAGGKRAPDLVAPGSSIVSLRAAGSFIDVQYAATGAVGTRFFKGSGTSQAAAVVSGASALLLSQRPWLSPDQVRDILRRSAAPVANASVDAQGAGSLDLAAAYATGGRLVATAKLYAGGGSLDAARGSFAVRRNGVTLRGEKDIFGRYTDTAALADQEEAGSAVAPWASGEWLGSPYLGATWDGATWAGATWAGATWAGATWAGTSWDGATWAGATWDGATWAGATWAGATWADAQWANNLWSSAGWS